jgi:hypothetical protein
LNQKKRVIYYLIFSMLGAALLIVASAIHYSDNNVIHMYDKLVVGGAFIISCIFGIYAAVKPDRMYPKRGDSQQSQIAMRGHHPDCEDFTDHVIKIKSTILCPGCSGLALGCVISILLMCSYIVYPLELQQIHSYILVFLGILFIVLNYGEMLIPARIPYFHLISNIFLVISFFLIILGILHLTGNMVYGLLAVLMSYLWLDTRIQLSVWRHSLVCQNCNESCKIY